MVLNDHFRLNYLFKRSRFLDTEGVETSILYYINDNYHHYE